MPKPEPPWTASRKALCFDIPLALEPLRPFSHPSNEPLSSRRCQIGQGVSPGGGAWSGEAAAWGDPLIDPSRGTASSSDDFEVSRHVLKTAKSDPAKQ